MIAVRDSVSTSQGWQASKWIVSTVWSREWTRSYVGAPVTPFTVKRVVNMWLRSLRPPPHF